MADLGAKGAVAQRPGPAARLGARKGTAGPTDDEFVTARRCRDPFIARRLRRRNPADSPPICRRADHHRLARRQRQSLALRTVLGGERAGLDAAAADRSASRDLVDPAGPTKAAGARAPLSRVWLRAAGVARAGSR